MNRRDFALGGLGGFLTVPARVPVQDRRQRIIVLLVDGLGTEYVSASDMLKEMYAIEFRPRTDKATV